MRIAVLGAGGDRKTEASIVRAARSIGHDTHLINVVGWRRYGGPLAGRIVRYLTDALEPDFLIITRHTIELGDAAVKALLRGREAVFWYFDLEPKDIVVRLGLMVGRMYVTVPGQVHTYHAAGVSQVGFMPQGVDPERDAPADSAPAGYRCESSFVGSGHTRYRDDVLRAVAAVSRLQIRGPGWAKAPSDLPVVGGPVHGRRLAQVIRGAAISLGANSDARLDSERVGASNRMWKILGCGGFYLGRYVEGIESFAAGGQHCAWYRDVREAAELTAHYLKRPEDRERIAREGRSHALAHHTYAHRLTLLLQGKGYPLPTIL
jgi:glycosyl transferase family 1